MLLPLVEVSPERDAMRRSVERARVKKGLFEAIYEIANDICDKYQIGMSGGPEGVTGD